TLGKTRRFTVCGRTEPHALQLFWNRARENFFRNPRQLSVVTERLRPRIEGIGMEDFALVTDAPPQRCRTDGLAKQFDASAIGLQKTQERVNCRGLSRSVRTD